jgi:hypothetical protein
MFDIILSLQAAMDGDGNDMDVLQHPVQEMDCLGTIHTACNRMRQTMQQNDVDDAVRNNINKFAAFGKFAVTLYLPEEVTAQMNIDMVPNQVPARVWIADSIDDGSDQHCRAVIAMQQLVLSHVAMRQIEPPLMSRAELTKWTADRCMTITKADLKADNLKYKHLNGWKRLVASYASHSVPRHPEGVDVDDAPEKVAMSVFGYNCADALRMQAALQR